METKFISEFGELDLSEIKTTTQENNSKVSDQKFSKFMFPFDILVTQDFIEKHGDYLSYESSNLKNKISGYLVHEGKVHDGELFIQKIKGLRITAQIDFGLEELPNFDKKLSELPLEDFKVDDIYTYARTICDKTYPQTNFNFPRIYTKRYSESDEVWKNFDGYYNDLKPDGSEMRRNYIDGEGGVWNVNIIHPCPHILYLLKTGFEDAGYSLQGEILTDPNLQNRWVFSGTEYFSKLTQLRTGLTVNGSDYDSIDFWSANYLKFLTIPKPGKYKITGYFNLFKSFRAGILLNGSIIWKKPGNDGIFGFNIDIVTTTENSVLTFNFSRVYRSEDLSLTVLKADLVADDLADESTYEGEDLGVITNLNEIKLARAVPAITFGDLVNVITNWFNYDVEVIDNTVIMNRIQTEDISEPKDFRFMEIPEPGRILLDKKSFLHKFTEMDEGFTKNSMFYDIDGAKLNGSPKTETSIIEVNGYAMELKRPKPGGYLTANVMKDSDSTVALVEYSGMTGTDNNAINSPGCDHPELFDAYWQKWFRVRLSGQEFNWQKNCTISEISQYSVKDFIFCYNNIHIIKSMTKEKISPTTYSVELVTETVV